MCFFEVFPLLVLIWNNLFLFQNAHSSIATSTTTLGEFFSYGAVSKFMMFWAICIRLQSVRGQWVVMQGETPKRAED